VLNHLLLHNFEAQILTYEMNCCLYILYYIFVK
jgi:hypothetical protein